VTQAALINGVLYVFLAVMVLLLVGCIMAVIVAPPQRPGSHTPQHHQAVAPLPQLPSRVPMTTAPPPTLPRRPPPVTPRTADFHGWAADDEATERGELQPMPHDRIPRPEVSSRPPWGPAPKPPGLDG
jgi:hypothetical protein